MLARVKKGMKMINTTLTIKTINSFSPHNQSKIQFAAGFVDIDLNKNFTINCKM